MSNDTEAYRPPGWLEAATVAWVHRVGSALALLRVLVDEAIANIDKKEELVKTLQAMEERLQEPVASIRELQNLVQLAPGGSLGPVQINSLLQKLSSEYCSSTHQPNIDLKLDAEVPAVKADPRLLLEALRNIVDNSIEAAAAQPNAAITITTAHRNGNVYVDIIDNGIGIPTELLSHIFQLGFTTRPAGQGMGLVISRRLLESWGGDIQLLTTSPNGTTFRITLSPWGFTHSRGHYALLVEDNIAYSRAVARLLRKRGIRVTIANTSVEAQAALRARAFDLVVLDVFLGDDAHSREHNGLDLARVARERNPQASIIMMSGYEDVRIVRDALSAGVDEFLSKASLRADEFYLAIDRAASRRGTERESIRQGSFAEMIYQAVSMMSHELRSPLLTIKRNAEALRAGALGPLASAQMDAVLEIQSATNREFVLLNAHLDLTRLEEGSERLDRAEYDLVALLREEIAAHNPEAARRGIRIRDVLPETQAQVLIDVNRFRVALNPLLDNAIKFSPEGQEVVVKGSIADRYVEVEIVDHGPGMKGSEIDSLLNPEGSLTKFSQRMRTSGLGLSMAKRMIEFHDGYLWIRSDGTSGTTVGFRIPIEVSRDES